MNGHNPLQGVQASPLTKKESVMQSFGLIRSWEQPEVIKAMEPKTSPPPRKPFELKQNYIVKRGNRLFILNKKYKGI